MSRPRKDISCEGSGLEERECGLGEVEEERERVRRRRLGERDRGRWWSLEWERFFLSREWEREWRRSRRWSRERSFRRSLELSLCLRLSRDRSLEVSRCRSLRFSREPSCCLSRERSLRLSGDPSRLLSCEVPRRLSLDLSLDRSRGFLYGSGEALRSSLGTGSICIGDASFDTLRGLGSGCFSSWT